MEITNASEEFKGYNLVSSAFPLIYSLLNGILIVWSPKVTFRPGAGRQETTAPEAGLTRLLFVLLRTVLAIAGEDFCIVASDTRLSEGYAIHSRDSPKCYKLTERTVIGCSGFHGDCLTLTKIIEARLKMYKHSNNKTMTTGAIAAMLSTILYSRRFFPYYVYNIIGGLDEEGKT